MTSFIPKTDLEWRDDLVDLFEIIIKDHDFEDYDDQLLLLDRMNEQALRNDIESIVRQIREEAVRAHGNGEGA